MAKKRHWGISVLAVLSYIGAVLTLIGGVAMLFGSAAIASYLATVPGASTFAATLGAAAAIVIGIILIALAVLDFFIGRGLWKGQNWARIVLIVLLAISAISAIISLSIVSLIIDAVIIWYLGFYKPAVAYFK